MNESIQVDISSVQRMFDALNPKQLASATRSAFGRSGRILLNAAKAAYRSMFPGSVLYRDMHMKAFRSGKGVMVDLIYTKRHQKGDPLYKSYVMKILEEGSYKTGQRITAKGYNRGSLRGYHFFQQGVSGSMNQAQSDFQQNLESAMDRKIKQMK